MKRVPFLSNFVSSEILGASSSVQYHRDVDKRFENLETAVTFCRPRDDGGPYTFNLAE